MKLCKDCVHLERSMIGNTYCKHPGALYSINRVTGRESFNMANYMRGRGKCGPDAELFEQKVSWFEKWFRK